MSFNIKDLKNSISSPIYIREGNDPLGDLGGSTGIDSGSSDMGGDMGGSDAGMDASQGKAPPLSPAEIARIFPSERDSILGVNPSGVDPNVLSFEALKRQALNPQRNMPINNQNAVPQENELNTNMGPNNGPQTGDMDTMKTNTMAEIKKISAQLTAMKAQLKEMEGEEVAFPADAGAGAGADDFGGDTADFGAEGGDVAGEVAPEGEVTADQQISDLIADMNNLKSGFEMAGLGDTVIPGGEGSPEDMAQDASMGIEGEGGDFGGEEAGEGFGRAEMLPESVKNSLNLKYRSALLQARQKILEAKAIKKLLTAKPKSKKTSQMESLQKQVADLKASLAKILKEEGGDNSPTPANPAGAGPADTMVKAAVDNNIAATKQDVGGDGTAEILSKDLPGNPGKSGENQALPGNGSIETVEYHAKDATSYAEAIAQKRDALNKLTESRKFNFKTLINNRQLG